MAAGLPLPFPTPLPPFLKHPEPSRSDEALLHCLLAIAQRRNPGRAAFISAMKASSLSSSAHHGRAVHGRILKSGLSADRFTATSIISFYSSFSDLDSARQVFDGILLRDVALHTALLVGYVRNGDIDKARILFDEMMEKDVVAWNAMLCAYCHCGLPEYALELFREMQMTSCRPNEVTLIAALSACAQLGCLDMGEWMYVYLSRHREIRRTTTLSNSLMHLYAKCGRIDAAFELFLEHSSKNLESWNTMLSGFAANGCGASALSLFSQMIKLGVQPDRITFIGILMACSHVGMIEHARRCFDCMKRFYGVEPGVEHYGCLVDVLARRGHLNEAWSVLDSMPMEPNAAAWGALLGGCLAHGNSELGVLAARNLIELEPLEKSRYVALQNLYAMAGRTEDALQVRKVVHVMGINQSSGMSTIEVGGVVHGFLAGDA